MNAGHVHSPVASNFEGSPSRLNRYMPCRTVGQGSFGKAVLVKCLDDQHHYIAKTVALNGLSQRDIDNCAKEIKILAEQQHPCIVHYIESFEVDKVLYIIQEYADGGDLLKYLNSRRGVPVTESRVLYIAMQVLLALQYLHDQHIIHRDIKTENIFLCKDGLVKLGDFGLSRVLAFTSDQANTICGTPNYFAPEMCHGGQYDTMVDIWALGCVLYEVINLERLFSAHGYQSLMHDIKAFKTKSLRHRGNYSYELVHLVQKCLQVNLQVRPKAEELLRSPLFAQAWAAFLDRVPVKGPKPATPAEWGQRSNNSPKDGKTAPRRLKDPPHSAAPPQDGATPTLQRLGLTVAMEQSEEQGRAVVTVLAVAEKSPAGLSKVLVQDHVVAWNKRPVSSIRVLEALAAEAVKSAVPAVTLNVLRRNKGPDRQLLYFCEDLHLCCSPAMWHLIAPPPASASAPRGPRAVVEPYHADAPDSDWKTQEASKAMGLLMAGQITRSDCERRLGDLDYDLYEVDQADPFPLYADDASEPPCPLTPAQRAVLALQMEQAMARR